MFSGRLTHATIRILDRIACRTRRPTTSRSNLRIGRRGEEAAYFYLRRHGYTMVARNFRSLNGRGEIDLIGWHNDTLCFVEVKTRSATGPSQPRPEEAVNHEKRRNLSRMARQFLRSRRIESATCRFDVLAIETRPGQKPTVRLHKDAFGMGAD